MESLFSRLFGLVTRLSAFALVASLLVVVGTQRVAASTLLVPSTRQIDSTRVDSLVREAEYIVKWDEFNRPVTRLTLSEQKLLQLTARELQSWTNKYLKPFWKREVVALRYFKYLVMTGRYYATASDFALALNAYKQAETVIPATSHLRVKAGKYSKELVAYKKRVEKLAIKYPPGEYEYASITMHLVGSSPPSKKSEEDIEPDGWGTPVKKEPAPLTRTIMMVKVLTAPYPLQNSDSL